MVRVKGYGKGKHGSSRNSYMPLLGKEEYKRRKRPENIRGAMARMKDLIDQGETDEAAAQWCSKFYYMSTKEILSLWRGRSSHADT